MQGTHEPRRSTTLPEHVQVSVQFSPYPTPSLLFFSLSPSLSSSSSSSSSSDDDDDDDDDDVRKDLAKSAGNLKGRNDDMEYPRPQAVTR